MYNVLFSTSEDNSHPKDSSSSVKTDNEGRDIVSVPLKECLLGFKLHQGKLLRRVVGPWERKTVIN